MKIKKLLVPFGVTLLIILTLFVNINTFAQKAFPNKDLKLLNGSVLDRKSTEDKLVIINLWATWCKPCISEIPELNKLVKEFQENEQVIFLALATDDSEKLKEFLTKREFIFIHLDNSNKVYFDKGILILKAYPRTLVYDKNGKLIEKYTGQLTGQNLDEIRKLIEKETL